MGLVCCLLVKTSHEFGAFWDLGALGQFISFSLNLRCISMSSLITTKWLTYKTSVHLLIGAVGLQAVL